MNLSALNLDKLRDVLLFDAAQPLLFNTGLFLVLFVFFILIYRLLAAHPVAKKIFVILFSLYFYYKSSAEYCFVLLGVCVFDYALGSILGNATKQWERRLCVWINVIVNVGMLFYFKYFNLLLDTINTFSTARFDALDIILPAGISFFTFRSISYIIDIYRRQIEPCTNFLDYCFFLTFFPPLLAGPVVRAKDMLPQVKENPQATHAMVGEGLFLIIAGLVKKVVVADFLGGNFVDRVFDNPSLYSGFENLLGVYGFALQLYCDFSGYSDMAIGIALLLGYRFKDNFRAPFKAQSPTEFWHRWHISLSTWLRDYIYIPLGGNRCSRPRKAFNQMTTMVVGGLWHGASWMYVIWGTVHGIYLIVHKELKQLFPTLPKSKSGTWWRVALNIFVTFNLIALTFMFFRASSLEKVGEMTHQILHDFHPGVAPQFINAYITVVVAIVFGFTIHFAPWRWLRDMKKKFVAANFLVQAILFAIVLFIIIQVRQSEIVPFIYLQY